MSSSRRAPVVTRRSGSTDAQRKPAMSLTPWIALAFGLSLAIPIYAQLPEMDAPAEVSRGAEASPSGTAGDSTDADKSKAQQSAFGALKDPIELCERLAGVEREICLRQAQENRERANAGVGATPGSGGTATGGVTPGGGADAGTTEGGAR